MGISAEATRSNEAATRYGATAEVQDVPSGFKRTEFGVIPNDWRQETIGNIADVGRGRVISHREISRSINPTYPVYSSQTTNEGTMGYLDTYEFEGEYATWTTDGANAGTVFYRNGRFNCTNVCGTIRPKKDDTFFVTKALSVVADRYVSRNLGNPKLMNDIVKQISIALPPTLAEQRAIAEALSDVDGLLRALESLIAKKRAIKQGAMQQLLTGKTRLPGFSGEWETKRIGQFTDCTAGGTPSTLNAAYWGGSIRWMNSGELNYKTVHDVEGRITDRGVRESSTKIIPARCVLIGLAGQGKTRGTVAMNMVELCTNQSIAAIFPNAAFVSEYLYFNLDSRYDELRGMSTGDGGRGGLNLRIIRSIAVPFPAVHEQTAIAAVLSEMDIEIAALERRRDKTRGINQGMMQQLLTGRVRFVEPPQAGTSA